MTTKIRTAPRILALSGLLFCIVSTQASGTGLVEDSQERRRNTGEVISKKNAISGVVLNESNRPVPFAVVRIQATRNQCITDSRGRFTLEDLDGGEAYTVSAWKDEYYCAKAEGVSAPAVGIELFLRLYQTNDNPEYEWMPPVGEESCFSCKPEMTSVWLNSDAHSSSAVNPRFLTMYEGSDVHGNLSPPTRYVATRDYGKVPIPADSTRPYYGPGYKLDFPESGGNCSSCHVPGAAISEPYQTDPRSARGADLYGIHCDFCHKVADVEVDPVSGLPYPNMPGVLSMDIRRPFTDDPDRFQLFFGSFDDDNVPEEDTKLPLISESRYCGACHYGVFWGTEIYNSYGEWLESPYADPRDEQSCQDCHMTAPTVFQGSVLTNVARDRGGVERDPMTIHSHTFPGASDVELLQNSLTMAVDARRIDDDLEVDIRLVNDKTGHHIPTDSPLRHMILLVTAEGMKGRRLRLVDGERLPDWCGIGDPEDGYYAGLPGKVYAKVLEELWTEVSPSGAYWNPTKIVSDNRIPAFGEDESRFVFEVPQDTECFVAVQLLYRRAFIDLAEIKGWKVSDIVMEEWRGHYQTNGEEQSGFPVE